MRLPYLLLFQLSLLSLWLGSADAILCTKNREFAVANCAACQTSDLTRPGNIPMAVCEEREANKTYACVCGNFPTYSMVLALRYYPQKQGNVTRCVDAQSSAPHLFIATQVGCECVCVGDGCVDEVWV